jgi:hypothetical protein
LFAAGATGIDLHLAQVQDIHRVEDEVDQMIGGHPVTEIGRQEKRGVAVNYNKAGGHVFQTRGLRSRSIRSQKHHPF